MAAVLGLGTIGTICVASMTNPALLRAAQAIWDRGRTTQPPFNRLSAHQQADLIADAEEAIRSLFGHSKALDRELQATLVVVNGNRSHASGSVISDDDALDLSGGKMLRKGMQKASIVHRSVHRDRV